MNAKPKVFFDTNSLLYLQTQDSQKIASIQQKLSQGGFISVQVLNEIHNVCRRKLKLSATQIDEFLAMIKVICQVQPLTIHTHELGVMVSQRFNLSTYDSMIVASTLLANCSILYSEDMQDGLVIQNRLTIVNPFK